MRWWAILLVAALGVLPRAAAAAEPPAGRPLRLAVVPFYSPEKIWALYQPLVEYLNASTPRRWELAVGDKHQELIAKLCAGELDVAYLGPIPYARADERCGAQPLVTSLGPDGKASYRGVIVTADPALRSVGDLKGRRFALLEMSTVSHHVALQLLAGEGLSLADVVPVWVPGQDRIAAAVLSGEVAAGTVKESLFETLRGQGLRAIKTSGPLPHFVFAARPGLPAEAAAAFARALLRLKPLADPADRARLAAWDPELAGGFAAPAASYRADARALLRAVEPQLKR